MCGIVALWGATDSELVERMMSRLAHRGPDGRELEPVGNEAGVFGHCRLAIIDPARGRQPMHAGAQSLIVNGMIYNYQALRAELPTAEFQTASDSETILHGYRKWGTDVVRRLDGMFAFVIADGERLIAARDPLGIKPLYTGKIGDAFAIASEIRALDGLADEVREFPPGHLFDSNNGFQPFYEIPNPEVDGRPVEPVIDEIRATLEESVRKRLRSDVPLGCFLSGGLDSSLIAAIARRHIDELHTFSVGLEGSADLVAAREVATHLGTIHHERQVTASEARDALPAVVRHLESYDRDLVRNAVPTWFVAREAAESGMKVILTGEGADELFAGYGYYDDYAADPEALQIELRRSLASLHDMNLQRVDRMTMAHGLEARVPFLDTSMVDLGMRVDPVLKQTAPDGKPMEKWALRQACANLLPDSILWREKAQFATGSGFARVFASMDGEEAYYRSILANHLESSQSLSLTSHWRDNRVPAI